MISPKILPIIFYSLLEAVKPQLFYQSPDTIEKNIKELVDKFKDIGLSLDKYITACTKQPQLFYQSSDTVEKNVKELIDKFKDNGLTLDKYIAGKSGYKYSHGIQSENVIGFNISKTFQTWDEIVEKANKK